MRYGDHLGASYPPLSQHLEITEQDLAQLERGRLLWFCWMTLYHSLLPRLTDSSGLFVSFSLHPLPSSLHFLEPSFFLWLILLRATLWTAASRRLLICTVRTPSSESVRVQTYKSVCVWAQDLTLHMAVKMDRWMDGRIDGQIVKRWMCVSPVATEETFPPL